MSSGADCKFIQRDDGWYLFLQCYPYGDIEDYDRFGPFKTQPVALAYLDDHFQNPGGYTTIPLDTHVCEAFSKENYCLMCGCRKM